MLIQQPLCLCTLRFCRSAEYLFTLTFLVKLFCWSFPFASGASWSDAKWHQVGLNCGDECRLYLAHWHFLTSRVQQNSSYGLCRDNCFLMSTFFCIVCPWAFVCYFVPLDTRNFAINIAVYSGSFPGSVVCSYSCGTGRHIRLMLEEIHGHRQEVPRAVCFFGAQRRYVSQPTRRLIRIPTVTH